MFNQPLEYCQPKLELVFGGKGFDYLTIMADNSIKYTFTDRSFFTIKYIDNVPTVVDYDYKGGE